MGNYSEGTYCDKPINNSGGMRLATYYNRAYHMGNQVEPWMIDVQQKNLKKIGESRTYSSPKELLTFQTKKNTRYWSRYKSKLSKIVFNFFYRYNL